MHGSSLSLVSSSSSVYSTAEDKQAHEVNKHFLKLYQTRKSTVEQLSKIDINRTTERNTVTHKLNTGRLLVEYHEYCPLTSIGIMHYLLLSIARLPIAVNFKLKLSSLKAICFLSRFTVD